MHGAAVLIQGCPHGRSFRVARELKLSDGQVLCICLRFPSGSWCFAAGGTHQQASVFHFSAMVSRYLSLAGLVAALATATPANNLLLRTASDGLATRGGVELARRSPLRRVDDPSSSDIKVERGLINLSKSFSIEGSLENEVLFDGYVNSARVSHGLEDHD